MLYESFMNQRSSGAADRFTPDRPRQVQDGGTQPEIAAAEGDRESSAVSPRSVPQRSATSSHVKGPNASASKTPNLVPAKMTRASMNESQATTISCLYSPAAGRGLPIRGSCPIPALWHAWGNAACWGWFPADHAEIRSIEYSDTAPGCCRSPPSRLVGMQIAAFLNVRCGGG
jgi:hypothetical protein